MAAAVGSLIKARIGPAEQPASTISPYDSNSKAPINEIINLTKWVPIRSAPPNEFIDLTKIDSVPRNHRQINRVNRVTRHRAVDAVGLESREFDMYNIGNFPIHNNKHKNIENLD